MIIVEYCRFGNLQSYVIKNRNNFINQVDEFGNIKTETSRKEESDDGPDVQQEIEISFSRVQDPDGYLVPNSSTDELNQSDSILQTDAGKPISTRDLLSWSFQIARGMDYLASKKALSKRYHFLQIINEHRSFPILQVLHGDLAARNVLLAGNGVVKVSDFGMARKMYYEENYEKKGQVNCKNSYIMSRLIQVNIIGILGSDSRQVDGTRISYGSHFVDGIRRLVLRDSPLGNIFPWQSSISR